MIESMQSNDEPKGDCDDPDGSHDHVVQLQLWFCVCVRFLRPTISLDARLWHTAPS